MDRKYEDTGAIASAAAKMSSFMRIPLLIENDGGQRGPYALPPGDTPLLSGLSSYVPCGSLSAHCLCMHGRGMWGPVRRARTRSRASDAGKI